MRDIIAHEVETMGLDEKRRLVDEPGAAIAEDLAGGSGEPAECPRCGCATFVGKGRGRRGERRWLCRGCGRTFSAGTGSVLARSRLDAGTWARFASCMVARLSLRETAAELGVCLSTAWFMRMRACEVMRSRLAGMRGGHAVQVDGTYLSESLSGDRSRPGAEPMPRPPRHHGGGVRLRGLSGEKVCVVCGANDLGDCFCEVASRGRCSSRGLADALRGHVGPGAAVVTDLHGGYPGALAELGVPSHEAHRAGDGANAALALVNALHARLRAFLARFAGVSTRRLQHYLDWFCYAEQYARTDAGREEVLAADQARGRYENSWRDLARTPQPFGEYWGMSTAL